MSFSPDATPDERLDEFVEKLEETFEASDLEIHREYGEITVVVYKIPTAYNLALQVFVIWIYAAIYEGNHNVFFAVQIPLITI